MEKKNNQIEVTLHIVCTCGGQCKNFKDHEKQTQCLRLWLQKNKMLKDLGIKSILSRKENTLGDTKSPKISRV